MTGVGSSRGPPAALTGCRGRYGITANSVLPPVTDTGWVTGPVRSFVADPWAHHHAVGPDEVAQTIAWLCSDDAWLVTGNRIVLRRAPHASVGSVGGAVRHRAPVVRGLSGGSGAGGVCLR